MDKYNRKKASKEDVDKLIEKYKLSTTDIAYMTHNNQQVVQRWIREGNMPLAIFELIELKAKIKAGE